jgi:enediyne biosynthesis protein E4
LFQNRGDGTFEDVSLEANVTYGRWAWGSLFFDVNNNGWEDLYVVNGFITTEDTGDL